MSDTRPRPVVTGGREQEWFSRRITDRDGALTPKRFPCLPVRNAGVIQLWCPRGLATDSPSRPRGKKSVKHAVPADAGPLKRRYRSNTRGVRLVET